MKRISYDIYNSARDAIELFLKEIIKDTIVYTENSRRITIMPNDVVNALKRNGLPIYLVG